MIYSGMQTIAVIEYIKSKYGDEPEFLWASTPKNAAIRHRDSLKWYAVILNIQMRKLGIDKCGDVDILDIKCEPELVGLLKSKPNYFPAYHMNKEHWVTVLLDEHVQLDEVFSLIDLSYNMTKKIK